MKTKSTTKKKMVMIGAGKIGRSFIGQLFSLSGYEVVFIDISKEIINELNNQKKYSVIIKGAKEDKIIIVKNVRGIHLFDEEKIKNEIVSTDIISISTGVQNWSSAIPALARGIEKRHKLYPDKPIDIIIAENVRDGASLLHKLMYKYVKNKSILNEYIGFVETSIGKMVPIMTKDEENNDVLRVFAEPYNNLIVDRKGFKNKIPDIKELSPKENIKAWVDRKLFIHNLGHAVAAYTGYLLHPEHTYIYEVLKYPDIKTFVSDTMHESAAILKKMYPNEFNDKNLSDHINDLISRFENKNLKDTVYRVGRDLFRKLGSEDRLVAVIMAGSELNMPFDRILLTLIAATFFRAKDENANMYEK
ncbi:MAG: mannitol-1-phosphate 5-dehydrogenase, partial [Chlorobi bacterium]|nr:mannitol-1-phosphate 5-dehydrogenase [Chlorobiota bacterium]